MIDSLLAFWHRRASILRWVLLFPVSAVFALASMILLYLVLWLLSFIWEDVVIWFWLRAIIFQVIFLLTLNQLSPGRGDIVVLVAVILRGLFLPLLIVGYVLEAWGYVNSGVAMGWPYWRDFLLEIGVLVAGIFVYLYSHRRGGNPQWTTRLSINSNDRNGAEDNNDAPSDGEPDYTFAEHNEIRSLEAEIKRYVMSELDNAMCRWLDRYKDDAGLLAITKRADRLRSGESKMAEYVGQAHGFAMETDNMEMCEKLDRYEYLRFSASESSAPRCTVTWEEYQQAKLELAELVKSEAPADGPIAGDDSPD